MSLDVEQSLDLFKYSLRVSLQVGGWMHAVYVGPQTVPTHVDLQLMEWEAHHTVESFQGSLEGAEAVLVYLADVPPTDLPVYDLALGGLQITVSTTVDNPVEGPRFVPVQEILVEASTGSADTHPDFESQPADQVAETVRPSNEEDLVIHEEITHEELAAWHKVNRLLIARVSEEFGL